MKKRKGLNRREFVGAGAGVAAAPAGIGGATQRSAARSAGGKESVPREEPRRPALLGPRRDRAAQHRFAAAARPDGEAQLQGFLGGPDYPEDPTDLGPLVPLRAATPRCSSTSRRSASRLRVLPGHAERQRVRSARQPTAPRSGRTSTTPGLVAQGTHQFGVGNLDVATGTCAANLTGSPTARARTCSTSCRRSGCRRWASPGTSRTSPRSENQVNPVTGAITFGFAARGAARHPDRRDPRVPRRPVLLPPEQDNYRFFADPAHPELNKVHRIQWVLANTDPKLFKLADRLPAQLRRAACAS